MCHLGDHRAEAAVPEAFLEAGEHHLVVAGLEINHAIGSEAGLRKRRGEEVRARNAPQHLAPCPGGDSRSKQRGGRTVDRTISAAGDFMERTQRQPASRQARVQFTEPKGQDALGARIACLNLPDLSAQRFDGGL